VVGPAKVIDFNRVAMSPPELPHPPNTKISSYFLSAAQCFRNTLINKKIIKMMEVSQNMELKELSTEGALLRTLSSDLSSEVEPVSTPGKCESM